MKFLVAILIMLFASEAYACNRCGQRQCVFVQRKAVVHQQHYVAPLAVGYQQPVINVTNHYRDGYNQQAYPLGNTVYGAAGVSQYAQMQYVNPEQQLAVLSRIADTLNNGVAKVTASIETNNAEVANLAKMQLAVQHLQAVAAVTSGSQGNQQLTLRLTNEGGKLTVEQVEEQRPAKPAPERPVAPVDSLLSSKCASCHGLDKAQPKGGLYYDSGHALGANESMQALDILRGNNVPDAMQAVVSGLTNEEKGRLMEEILSLWKRDE